MTTPNAPRKESTVKRAVTQPRIVIDKVSPCVDQGRYAAKKTVDQAIPINATIFMDGHDKLAARVLWKEARGKWRAVPMRLLGNDLWQAELMPVRTGKLCFRIEAWYDQWGTYTYELRKKSEAGVPVQLEVTEGSILLHSVLQYANKDAQSNVELVQENRMDKRRAEIKLQDTLTRLEQATDQGDQKEQVTLLLEAELAQAVESVEEHKFLTQSERIYEVDIERTAANFASWYELFPRSLVDSAESHGTFDDVIGRLPAIHAMGFDVLYFPPIHPIGKTHRKGRNNSVTAAPDEPGSPYAIGSEEGGHNAIHQQLGGIEAFRRLRAAVGDYGIELALDFAIQCSPDHPWLKEHPGWFSWRPDGSIRYAENPPKKYQDIVNVDFYAEDAVPELWLAWRDVVLFWVSEGVKIFRVDNPHTKPFPFWEWVIGEIRRDFLISLRAFFCWF